MYRLTPDFTLTGNLLPYTTLSRSPARETHRLEALAHRARQRELLGLLPQRVAAGLVGGAALLLFQPRRQAVADPQAGLRAVAGEVEAGAGAGFRPRGRPEERRVGKGGVSKCRARWSTKH